MWERESNSILIYFPSFPDLLWDKERAKAKRRIIRIFGPFSLSRYFQIKPLVSIENAFIT